MFGCVRLLKFCKLSLVCLCSFFCTTFFQCSHRFRLLPEIYVVLGRLGCSQNFLLIDLSCYGCFKLR